MTSCTHGLSVVVAVEPAVFALDAGHVPATATRKPIVVVVSVQQGGFGDLTAAPVARRLFSQWLLGTPGSWRAGHSTSL